MALIAICAISMCGDHDNFSSIHTPMYLWCLTFLPPPQHILSMLAAFFGISWLGLYIINLVLYLFKITPLDCNLSSSDFRSSLISLCRFLFAAIMALSPAY